LADKYGMVDLRKYIRYLPPQGTIGCCTASAALIAAEIMCNKSNQHNYFSRLFVYYTTRKIQGRINEVGAELSSTLESMKQHGACSERIWPFRKQQLNIEPTTAAYQEAAKYRIQKYENVYDKDFNYLLEDEVPIIIGLKTGRLFRKLSGPLNEQVYKLINTTDNRPSHGHAVTIIGFDDNLLGGSWIIANSFGPKWGHYGYGILPYECREDIGEAYVIRQFSGITAGRKISDFDK
jgi:C1A family cysteine protease